MKTLNMSFPSSAWLPLLLMTVVYTSTFGQAADFPRDTSYNPRTAYSKLVKNYPDIIPVVPEVPPGVAARWDVVYARIGDRALHLDIFYPERPTQDGYPGVLLIHGGGWASGTRIHQVPLAQALADRGYVAAAVEYRLSPEAPYPAAVHDLKAALRWLRAHAADFQLDTSRIASLGASAGAQLASLLGTTNGMSRMEGTVGTTGYSSAVQAVVNVDGIVSFIHPEADAEGAAAARWLGGTRATAWDTWKDASPLEYAGAATPPFLFINSAQPRFHAGRDDLMALLRSHQIYTEMHTLEDSPHSFWLFHPWFEPTLHYTVSFLDKIFK